MNIGSRMGEPRCIGADESRHLPDRIFASSTAGQTKGLPNNGARDLDARISVPQHVQEADYILLFSQRDPYSWLLHNSESDGHHEHGRSTGVPIR